MDYRPLKCTSNSDFQRVLLLKVVYHSLNITMNFEVVVFCSLNITASFEIVFSLHFKHHNDNLEKFPNYGFTLQG
jgi:hypothetical protein